MQKFSDNGDDDITGLSALGSGFDRDVIVRSEAQLLIVAVCIAFASLVGVRIVHHTGGYGISESGFFIIVGILVSIFNVCGQFSQTDNVQTTSFYSKQLYFDGKTFICFFLPPIVFSTGYCLDRKIFSQEICIIYLLAHIGTVVSSVFIGYALYLVGKYSPLTDITLSESLTFGSLLSATDPVATLSSLQKINISKSLYTIILAASVLDDAISIILFDVFSKQLTSSYAANESSAYTFGVSLGAILFSFCVSWLLGYLAGVGTALLLHNNRITHRGDGPYSTYFVIFIVCMAYTSFYVAGILKLSGITSCFFAGLTFRKFHEYVLKCCKAESMETPILDHDQIENIALDDLGMSEINSIEGIFGFLSSIMDSLIFFSIGMSFITEVDADGSLDVQITKVDIPFVLWTILFMVVSRALFVYPLCAIANRYNFSNYSPSLPIKSSDTNDVTATAIAIANANANTSGIIDPLSPSDTSSKATYLTLQFQHYIFLSGLRGPVGYAAASIFPRSPSNDHSKVVLIATKLIVVITVLINGGLMAPIHYMLYDSEGSRVDRAMDEGRTTNADKQTSHSSTELGAGGGLLMQENVGHSIGSADSGMEGGGFEGTIALSVKSSEHMESSSSLPSNYTELESTPSSTNVFGLTCDEDNTTPTPTSSSQHQVTTQCLTSLLAVTNKAMQTMSSIEGIVVIPLFRKKMQ